MKKNWKEAIFHPITVLMLGLLFAFHTQIIGVFGIAFNWAIGTKIGFVLVGTGAIWLVLMRFGLAKKKKQ